MSVAASSLLLASEMMGCGSMRLLVLPKKHSAADRVVIGIRI